MNSDKACKYLALGDNGHDLWVYSINNLHTGGVDPEKDLYYDIKLKQTKANKSGEDSLIQSQSNGSNQMVFLRVRDEHEPHAENEEGDEQDG